MSKISELSDGGALQSTDFLIAVRSGGNVKVQPAGMTFSSATFTTVDINGGTIDGAVIGGTTAAAGSFTTLNASGHVNFDSGTFFVDASADAVGIGTSSPGVTLDVNGGTNTQLRLTASDSLGSSIINFGDQSNVAVGRIIYSHVTDSFSFKTNNVNDRLFIDSSGSVGIGTSSPVTLKSATTLQVDGNAKLGDDNGRGLLSFGDIASTGANVGIWRGAAGAYAGTGNYLNLGGYDGIAFTTGNADIDSQTERMRITSSGELLVGKTATGYSANGAEITSTGLLYLPAGSTSAPALTFSGDTNTGIGFGGADILYFTNGGSESARLNASGNLLVGTTTTAYGSGERLSVVTSGGGGGTTGVGIRGINQIALGIWNQTVGSSTLIGFSANTAGSGVGSITTNGTTTAYNTSSDARLKENIADAEDASSLVDAIKVRQFDWKADGSHQRYGMVAQELLEVAPEAVSGDPESDDMMGVDYSKLVPMLVKEIQSLRARVAQLEGA